MLPYCLISPKKTNIQQSNNPTTNLSWKKQKVAISSWRRELALVPNHSKPVSFRYHRGATLESLSSVPV